MLGQQAFWDSMSLALAILDTINPFMTMFNGYNCATSLTCFFSIFLFI